MKQLRTIRGVHDMLPKDYGYFQFVVDKAIETVKKYGFQPINLPLIEEEEVFKRTLGETSDVVSKEMFRLEGRELDGGEKEARVVLRPEATASVVRAFLQHGLHHELPQKLYYYGPMFRYERPQKGRLRQFHQFGVEFIGIDDPYQDVEIIAAGHAFLKALGLETDVRLQINTLGDAQSRGRYRDALVTYFSENKSKLSADSKTRLEKNPLRILDSKDEGDRALCQMAPKFETFLSQESKDHFDRVQEGLKALGISFEHNPYLVRGLDYYCHTAFEFVTESLGAQGTVLAGGRYDGLAGYMGGDPVPSKGWAAGIERLMLLLQEKGLGPKDAPIRLGLVPLGETNELPCLKLAAELREQGFIVDLLFKGNMGKRLKRLDKSGADVAVLMGDEERTNSEVTVKLLKEGKQEKVMLSNLKGYLEAL